MWVSEVGLWNVGARSWALGGRDVGVQIYSGAGTWVSRFTDLQI
jgi:hypothetical protein